MKLILTVVVLILFGGAAQAQSADVEVLQKTVQDQSREIEELKARIARIEQLLSRSIPTETVAVVQPASLRENITAAPIVRPLPATDGSRTAGDCRFPI